MTEPWHFQAVVSEGVWQFECSNCKRGAVIDDEASCLECLRCATCGCGCKKGEASG